MLAIVRLPLALSVLSLFLSACAIVPMPPTKVSSWQAEGKLALKFDETSHSAYFSWLSVGDDYSIDLYGAFGLGRTVLKKDARGVTLKSATLNLAADSAEQLLSTTLGWDLPVSELQYWLRGLPSPLSPVLQLARGRDGELLLLHQNGWVIRYKRYVRYRHKLLPHYVHASHQGRGVSLRVAIKKWQISD